MTAAASICADFVLAYGPRAGDWLRALTGFEVSSIAGGSCMLATRGPVRSGQDAEGRGWLALADLVEGSADSTDNAAAHLRGLRGRFAHVAWTPTGDTFEASTDHLGSLPLYWYRRDGHFAVSTDLRLLLDAPGVRREADLTAVYHYLNFGCIPAPASICTDIRRIEPGTTLRLHANADAASRYYVPQYPVDLDGDDATLTADLRRHIEATVDAYRPQGEAWGCFLSGGTDSSSIVSILAAGQEAPVDTCSIGFHEAGYDELDFARIASEACGGRPRLGYVDSARALDLLDEVIDAYDQPFGNASAVPTLACAELGRAAGFTTMLGGDGGDEIFGGNARYAKDKVLQAFHRLPSPLKALARAIGNAVGGGNNHFLNRVRNFTQRGSLPNPDRFYTDDSFASDHYEELLTPAFREHVDRNASLEFMRALYDIDTSGEPLHRIMRLDLLMAIAQNDLVKVHGACKHHGVAVRFPYIDPALVAYCGRLPARHKVRGLDKRHLFKKAMRGILPDAILRKPKQGFGLPTAVWLKDDPAVLARTREILLDERTRERGWIDPSFVNHLIDRHAAGGWDYSTAIWQLLVLELWMRRYMDAR